MMSPLKLSVIVCGAAAGLAVAPYVVKQILPPVTEEIANVDKAPSPAEPVTETKLDLPIVGQNTAPVAAAPALALAAPQKEEAAVRPELHLTAPALPSPAPVQQELTLPSLSAQIADSAMPAPAITPAPTPVATPAPTPEIPYRGDVETAQVLMKKLGLNTGKIDGKLGPNTQTAVRNFQKKEGLPETGDVNPDLLARMEKQVAAIPTPTPAPAPESNVVITDASTDAKKVADEEVATDANAPEAILVRANAAKAVSNESKVKTEVAAAASKPKVDPGPVPTLKNKVDVKKLQTQLKEAGTYTGNIDGRWGDLTRTAMREFQQKANLEVTGKPNKETWLAMHAEAPAVESEEEVKPTEIAADLDSMKISTADAEVPSLSEDKGEFVVTLNGDGAGKPGSTSPLPTPATISSLEAEPDAEVAEEKSSDAASKPKVKVSAPPKNDSELADKGDQEPADLAVAEVDEDAEAEKLRKEIESTRARIESVSKDSEYEVKKYAPKMLEAVNNMADNLQTENVSNNPVDTKARIKRIEETLEKAKDESKRKKAEGLVVGVRDSYKSLKANFNDRIKALSLKDPDEKSQREELTVLVADVDLGFETMEKDFKANKFDPIFENAVPFKNTIDQINQKLAQLYVDAKLEDKTVKSKLEKDELKDIESFIEKDDHLKAAEMLEKLTASSTKKKS